MADQKISELTAATAGASADLLHVVQGGTNKKLTVANLFAGIDTNIKLDGYIAFKDTPQAITASGSTSAVDVTSPISQISITSSTTGANALTLADGVQGQIKIITVIANSNDGVLEVQIDPDNFANGSSITMDSIGQTVTLLFTNSNWVLLANVDATIA
jgi:hypothetical protein